MKKKTRIKKHVNKLGDTHTVDGIECVVRHVNAGMGWMTPVKDDDSKWYVARHIAYARIDERGKINRIK